MLIDSVLTAFLALNHPTDKIFVTLDLFATQHPQGKTVAKSFKTEKNPFKVNANDRQAVEQLLIEMGLDYWYQDKSAQVVTSVTADELNVLLLSNLFTNAHLSGSIKKNL